jgi:hypothetical protein
VRSPSPRGDSRCVAVPGGMMLYEYPEWGYNVYADPDMTMEVAETPTSPWQHINADPGESQDI